MKVHDEAGNELDATFSVELQDGGLTLVFESKGGTDGASNARNMDYSAGLEVLLARLRGLSAMIKDAAIETRDTRALPLPDRRLNLEEGRYPVPLADVSDITQLRLGLSRAQAAVGRKPGSKGGGNPTKRLRLFLDVPGVLDPDRLARLLGEGKTRPIEADNPPVLLDQCVYTIVERNRLWAVSRDGGVSEPITEGRRWVGGKRLLDEAGAKNSQVALLFGDAADCSQLIAWALLDSVEIRDKTTDFKFRELRELSGHAPQELVLVSSGETMAPGFIRPYAICFTPDFLDDGKGEEHPELLADEIVGLEGEVRERMVRHRRRERRLRDAKIRSVMASTGCLRCEVPGCGFDFFRVYGEPGRDFAHVHHLSPLSERTENDDTKIEDLAVVCANCHAIIHRGGGCRPLKGLVRRRGEARDEPV